MATREPKKHSTSGNLNRTAPASPWFCERARPWFCEQAHTFFVPAPPKQKQNREWPKTTWAFNNLDVRREPAVFARPPGPATTL